VIFDVNPVAHLQAVAVNGKRLVFERIGNHRGMSFREQATEIV
jgi:hypothetical protein